MLKLIHIATNTAFQLPATLRIPFTINSPIFAESGSQTFSATISARSAVNRRLTGYQHRPGKPDNSGTLIPVFLELNGQRKRCTMNIIEADENEIKYNLLIDEGSFLVEHGEKLLNELDFGGEETIPDMEIDSETGAKKGLPPWNHEMYTKFYPEVKAAFFPVYNPNFFDGTEYEVPFKGDGEAIGANSRCINMPGDKVKPLDITIQGQTLLKTFHVYPISPFPFLAYVVEQIFRSWGIRIKENFIMQTDLKKLCLLNNVDTAKSLVNVSNEQYVWITCDRDKYNIANHVPKISIKKILSELRNKFNIVPIIDDSSKEVRLLNVDSILDKPVDSDLSENFSNLRLKEVKNYTGYAFIDKGSHDENYNSQVIDPRELEGQIVEPGFTVSDQFYNGYFRLNEIRKRNYGVPTDSYLKLAALKDEITEKIRWDFIGWLNHGNLYEGSSRNELKFESEFSHLMLDRAGAVTLKFWENNVLEDRYFRIPIWNIPGNSELIPDPNKDNGLNLLFYNGLKQNELYLYPTSGPDNDDTGYQVGEILYNMSYHGTNGLVDKYWKKTLNMYLNRGRIFEADASLPVAKIFTIDWAKKHHIHGGTFMLKSIKGYFNYDGSITYDANNSELIEV